MFLLDSGAFTFLNKSKKSKEFNKGALTTYVDDYINFINKWDIQYFFEFDIDGVIGYNNVKRIRRYIEEKTGKKCIPVWHINRGLEDFESMCQEYDYVAIGGIASKEIPKKYHKLFHKLCDIAHENDCKVHGLGYLSLVALNDDVCPFDTCDGTGWQGHMRGCNFQIVDDKIEKIKDGKYWKDVARECFSVWTDFSEVVEENNTVQYQQTNNNDRELIKTLINDCISYHNQKKQGEK